jgi:renalase
MAAVSAPTTRHVLVVGAGMAGLECARRLCQLAGDGKGSPHLRISIVDKGRGVGGRMATRRFRGPELSGEKPVVPAAADIGAMFFTVRGEEFSCDVDEWLRVGAARLWAPRGFPFGGAKTGPGGSSGAVVFDDSHPRYCGVGGMTAIPKAILASCGAPHVTIDLRLGERVCSVRRASGESGWRVFTTPVRADAPGADDLVEETPDAVVLTAPAPQALELVGEHHEQLPESGSPGMPAPANDGDASLPFLPPDILAKLHAIRFDPCFALAARLDRSSALASSHPGAVNFFDEGVSGEPLNFISDNQEKGVSEHPSVTIHAGPQWTRDHFDDDSDEVAQALLDVARPHIGDEAKVLETTLQRWRYARPVALADTACVAAGGYDICSPVANNPPPLAPIVFCGDGYGRAAIEGAFYSGRAAADEIVQRLRLSNDETVSNL